MDPRLLRLYDQELNLLRGMGAEFAAQFPKIAGRLGLERLECSDPYVERLLEGFGFLAARVQLKIDSEFPRFTQHLLENVFPHYLSPTPSMTVVQFEPDSSEGELSEGFGIERGTTLRSLLGRGEDTACEYRTAHPTTLWPVEIGSVAYRKGSLPNPEIHTGFDRSRAALHITLRTAAGLRFDEIALDRLVLFIQGDGELPNQLYEQMLGQSLGVVAQPPGVRPAWREALPRVAIQPVGFADDEALLPFGARSFQGYRLLQEYFSFPQRFSFVEISGLQRALKRCDGNELELVVLMNRSHPALENAVDTSHIALHCVPAVNLFEKRTDRAQIREDTHELHVVADRTRPMDFEIHTVQTVEGFGSGQREQAFLPFYKATDRQAGNDSAAYFTVRREPRLLSSPRQQRGPRSSYIGTETFIALVDGSEAPYAGDLREVGITALCTNRDLPLMMAVGRGATDFRLESGAPVQSIRCVAGPTRPIPSRAEGEAAWRMVSHLTLNYLSLADSDSEEGAAALRSLLMLYGDPNEADVARRIEGILSVHTKPITRRLASTGPATFLRGLEVSVTVDEAAFEGFGAFMVGAVLAQFFARYVSINSFTETVLVSTSRGEVMRWPANPGRRLTL